MMMESQLHICISQILLISTGVATRLCSCARAQPLRHIRVSFRLVVHHLEQGRESRQRLRRRRRRSRPASSSSVVHHHLSARRLVTGDVACLRHHETRRSSLRPKLVYFHIVPSGTSIALGYPSSFDDTRDANLRAPI